MFGVYQGRLSRLLAHYQDQLGQKNPVAGPLEFRKTWLFLIPAAMLLLHVGATVLWIALWVQGIGN